MLRGRIAAARVSRRKTSSLRTPANGCCRATAADLYRRNPQGSQVIEGQWWGPDYQGPPLVSMEKKNATGSSSRLATRSSVNVLGRDIPATIANLRKSRPAAALISQAPPLAFDHLGALGISPV